MVLRAAFQRNISITSADPGQRVLLFGDQRNAPNNREVGVECPTLHSARGRERATVDGKYGEPSENQRNDWEEARGIKLIEHTRYHIGGLRGFREWHRCADVGKPTAT